MSDNDALPGGIELSDAIEALREQIGIAMITGVGSAIKFKPGPVELTVEAAVTKNFGGKAGVKWWLIEAGAEASRESVVTQTLKLTLTPVLLDSEGHVIDTVINDVDDSPGTNQGNSQK